MTPLERVRKVREIIDDLVQRCGATLTYEEQAILVDDFCELLAEAEARGRTGMRWRPISEARMTEKQQVLIWLPSTGLFLAVWMSSDGWGTSEEPTHFMLIDPPAAAEK